MNFKNNFMILQCPFCSSENVTNLSLDSNDFICNECGEDFKGDNGIELDNEEGETSNDASFIDIDPKAALSIQSN